VEKHIKNIFIKINLAADEELHRRVLAVLTYLRGQLDALSSNRRVHARHTPGHDHG